MYADLWETCTVTVKGVLRYHFVEMAEDGSLDVMLDSLKSAFWTRESGVSCGDAWGSVSSAL